MMDDSTVRDDGYEERMKVVSRKNYMRICIMSLYGVMFGYYIAIFNPLGDPLLRDVYKLDSNEIKGTLGNINMLFAIGAFFSVLSSGYVSEQIGRRRLIIVFDVCNVVIIALYYFQDLRVLQVARFLTGWTAAGMGMVSSILITEVIPKKLSGTANSFLFAVMTSFIFLAYIQPNIFSRAEMVSNWRLILCWPIVPLAFKMVFFPIIMSTESPKYIVRKHKEEDGDLNETIMSVYSSTYRGSQVKNISDITLKVYEMEKESSSNSKGGLGVLCSPLVRNRLITGIALVLMCQLGGISYFALYSTDLFNRISGKGKEVTTTIAVMKVVAGVVGVLCMKNFGRKVNLMFGTLTQGISVTLIISSINLDMPIISYLGISLYTIAFGVGQGSSYQSYLTEILPPKGASLCNGLYWLLNSVIVKILPILADKYGDEAILFSIALFNLIGFFLLDYVLVETKDKTEDIIIRSFEKRRYRFLNFK